MPLDSVAPEPRQPGCARCEFGPRAATVCMPAQGEPGGLLVLGGSPTQGDDESGQPFSTEVGRRLRRLVERSWSGPVRYAYGLSCRATAKLKNNSEHYAACAPYLAWELDQGAQRVLLLGADAARAAFGFRFDPVAVRRAWGYVRGVPCFLAPHPQQAAYNKFVRGWLEADVAWALKTPLPAPPAGEVHVHWDPGDAVAYLGSLQPGVPVSVDIENVGDCWKDTWRFLCVALSTSAVEAHVLPAEVLQEPAVHRAFARFLADGAIPKGGQFFKYDVNGMHREFGVEVRGLDYDTGFMRRLVEPESPAGLRVLAYQVGFGGYKQLTEAQMGEDSDKSAAYGKLPPDQLHGYCGRDAVVAHRYKQLLDRPGRFAPYQAAWSRIVRPAIMALAQVERWGALVNQTRIAEYDAWLAERYERLDKQLRATPGVPEGFNPNSGKQVGELLFDVLKLPSTRKTKTGARSTDKKARASIAGRHPVVKVLTEMTMLAKQRSTYGLRMLDHVGMDGRIHTSFGIIRSGRLSSSRPNLQNLTSRGEEGKRLRACFVAPPGHLLVSTDYSQIELRILADLSGDEAMIEAFERGGDFHTEMAAEMAKVEKGTTRDEYIAAYGDGESGEQWAIDLRKAAKVVNFALIFGQGDKALAEGLTEALKKRISKQQAGDIRAKALAPYPKLVPYQRRLIAEAELTGEAWTDFDGCRRRRSLWRIAEPAGSEEESDRDPRNVARNHPIQGTASEYTISTLNEVVARQQEGELPGRLVLTIHDENVSEVPEADVMAYARDVNRIMLSWPTKRVKLKVDTAAGPSLGELQKIKVAA